MVNRNITSYYSDPEVAKAFDTDRYGGPVGKWVNDLEKQMFSALGVKMQKASKVLDIGSGTGKLDEVAKSSLFVGLDRSLPMLLVGKRSMETPHPLILGDAQRLPFVNNAFDLVLASRLLLHLPNWQSMISESCRVARSAVILDFPTSPSLAALEPNFWSSLRGSSAPPPHRIFTPGQVRDAFEISGFTCEEMHKGLILPYRFHRCLGNPRLSRVLEGIARRTRLTSLFGSPSFALFAPRQPSSKPTSL